MWRLSAFEPGQEAALWQVYYWAIHRGCANEYSLAQRAVWAPKDVNLQRWAERIKALNPIIAYDQSTPVGYADIQKDGYIDHFFVHGAYQGKGVGQCLMTALLEYNKPRYYSKVSDTAYGFFVRFGFEEVERQQVKIQGVVLNNTLMQRVRARNDN